MPRRTTAAESPGWAISALPRHAAGSAGGSRPAARAARSVPMHVVLITMDLHLAGAVQRAERRLATQLPGLRVSLHAAATWADDPAALERCRSDIASGDLVIATMLFMEEHFLPVLDALRARREDCDAMVCAMSAGDVMRLTRMGRFRMDAGSSGPLALLRKLRGSGSKPAATADGPGRSAAQPPAGAGARQMKMLRRLPQLLRFIPGTAQDLRAWFLTLQYWLAGSEDNLVHLVLHLVERYAAGPREVLRERAKAEAPREYPEVGLYHPSLKAAGRQGMTEHEVDLPGAARPARRGVAAVTPPRGTVGLLLMRSYLLAGNTAHYDGVIAALEARGLRVLPAFASGLDARPAVERHFLQQGRPVVDAVVSLTGFSLVGGPAYNDARAAEAMLAQLDVPYLATLPVEFQTLAQWESSERGLLPVEATMMVAIPELDGATGAMVYGGRGGSSADTHGAMAHDMQAHPERAAALAARVGRWIDLRQRPKAERRVGVVLFQFPPHAGNAGTAAFLGVFESLWHTLRALQRDGYTVNLPADVDALREALIAGNAERHGTPANVALKIPADEHVRRERWLGEIEAAWGPAPGRHLSDGRSLFVLGAQFGNVFVGLQPGMGIEGDPMKLLFDRGFAPTHAFSAFYRWLREDFRADALLHFGTHGALEFMPGKQAGLSGRCWPERLIGDVPHLYLYAANNPSEGTLAKRRAGATLVSYLTPPLTEAGLYRGLADLKATLERWRLRAAEGGMPGDELDALATLAQAQAAAVELSAAEPAWTDPAAELARLQHDVLQLEHTLIPHGLHVVGRTPGAEERRAQLQAMALAGTPPLEREAVARAVAALVEAAAKGAAPAIAAKRACEAAPPSAAQSADWTATLERLAVADHELQQPSELTGLLRALDGRYLRPAPGGDLLRTPEILPTGRNLHGFDPFRIPSAWAVQDGARQAARLLARHQADGHALPETVALVLWGTDNLKTEGAPIGQALALLGARPRFDGYGRLAGASLIPLAELGRPRVDVMVTLSGIFRDLLPLQIKLLAEAALMAAEADEPVEQNYVRKHGLARIASHGGDMSTAALRVFGNAEGAYGANVNHLLDSSRWDDEDQLAETYTRRKCYAYGANGRAVKHDALLQHLLADVQLAYQNLESVELGVTTVDTYFDTLGGISRAVRRAKLARGDDAALATSTPVYIGDQTCDAQGGGTVRTLAEQVALETRTRMLNPVWYEGLLAHGYEGVRQIEAHVTNTLGWSATTGQVQPWVWQQLSQTFLLDPAMRERLAKLNPGASAKLAGRLIEATQRRYWQPEPPVLEALQRAGEELEDRLEGVYQRAPA